MKNRVTAYDLFGALSRWLPQRDPPTSRCPVRINRSSRLWANGGLQIKCAEDQYPAFRSEVDRRRVATPTPFGFGGWLAMRIGHGRWGPLADAVDGNETKGDGGKDGHSGLQEMRERASSHGEQAHRRELFELGPGLSWLPQAASSTKTQSPAAWGGPQNSSRS